MVSRGFEAATGPGEIYYLLGMGGRLDAGLGKELLRRGFALSGRETIGAFKKLSFGEQVDAVKQDLVERLWKPEARLIANSFGGHRQNEVGSHPLDAPIDGLRHATDGLGPAEDFLDPLLMLDRQGVALMSGRAPIDRSVS